MSLTIGGGSNVCKLTVGGGTSSSCCPSNGNNASECADTVCIDFNQFTTGQTNLIFPGLTLSTNLVPVDNPLMIFDSAAPTLGQEALGTPNETCCVPPGPGIGAGGEVGKPGENCDEQNKILIISADPPTPGTPVPKSDGGIITVDFAEDVTACEIHFLNVTVPCGEIKSYDFDNNELTQQYLYTLGANSFQIQTINASKVRKLTIDIKNDVGIAKIVYKICRDMSRVCVQTICEDFDSFAEGETSLMITGGSITSGMPGTKPAMIFNSSVPTGGDTDLGSPNDTCTPPGPGTGAGGEVGEPGENCEDLGNILIISTDGNSADPKAEPTGGQLIFTFTKPVVVCEVHFLNATTDGDTINLFDAVMNPLHTTSIPNVGANGFAKVQMKFPYTSQKMIIDITGKTAVTKIVYKICADSAATSDEICLEHIVEDWEGFVVGDPNVRHPDFTFDTIETMMIQNVAVHNNVLIASTDGNSETPVAKPSTYDVDINFRCPVWLYSMTFLDCNSPGCTIDLFDWDDAPIGTFPIANLGLGSNQTIVIDTKGVKRADITTFGAISEINYFRCCKQNKLPNICAINKVIDFSTQNVGERNIYYPRLELSTDVVDRDYPLMIFDSANPGLDTQLGTPNADFAGPGTGTGDETDQPGENNTALGNVLIVSKDGNSETPSPKSDGASITFTFECPVELISVGLLNATTVGDTIVLKDEQNNTIDTFNIGRYGANGVQTVLTNTYIGTIGAGARGVKSFTVNTTIDLAVTRIEYNECCSFEQTDNCLEEVTIDFDEFVAGDRNMLFSDFDLSVDTAPAMPLMIFDTTAPSGGDADLGTPNVDFAGPGVGTGGETGKPGENNTARGNALIISADNNPADPDASDAGGVITIDFNCPVVFQSIDFINVEDEDTTIEFFDKDNVSILQNYIVRNGANGIATYAPAGNVGLPAVKKAVINLENDVGILEFTYYRCKNTSSKTETVLLLDNAMTPVDITCTEQQGSYMLLVKSALMDGAGATFMASSAFDAQAGSFTRLTSAPSSTDETVHITWNANEKIKLYHDTVKTGGTGATIPYTVKLFSL